MKKRFIVCLDSATAAQNEGFKVFLNLKAGVFWWHWLTGTWLIIDPNGLLTAAELRNSIMTFYPNVDHFVVELRADGTESWSGFGPGSESKNMFKWIHKYWSRG